MSPAPTEKPTLGVRHPPRKENESEGGARRLPVVPASRVCGWSCLLPHIRDVAVLRAVRPALHPDVVQLGKPLGKLVPAGKRRRPTGKEMTVATFVLIHGGYPYTLDMIWLTAAKNVYTDSSLVGYYVYPSELKNILKQWISLYPEKIMFGSDAFPFNEAVGAEETFWLAARSARTAVAAALAELVAEGAVTEEKALELARLYLHDNAAKLYGDLK